MRTVTRYINDSYDELRRIARSMPGARGFPTRQPTEFLDETLGHLYGRPRGTWKDRQHFMASAVIALRRRVATHRRRDRAMKRGGGYRRVTVSNLAADCGLDPAGAIALRDGLERLRTETRRGDRAVRIIDLRYGWGLSWREIADSLEVDLRTVTRSHAHSIVWLRKNMIRL